MIRPAALGAAVAAAAATLALVAPAVYASAATMHLMGGAAPAATTPPPFEPDHNAIGSVSFFNAAGQVITSGTDDSFLASFVEASTPDPCTPIGTKAQLFFANPQPNVNGLNWLAAVGSVSSVFPNSSFPGVLGTTPNPVIAMTAANGDADLLNFAAGSPENTAAGFVNVYQVRIETNAPGGGGTIGGTCPPAPVEGATLSYWESDVQVDPSTGAWQQIFPAVQTATTTTLTASPNPATQGQAETLTATEAPATAGSVTFMNGTTTLGTATVNASTGVATLSTTFDTAGTQSLSAVFAPSDATDFSGSTGTLSLTVNGNVTATPTTTVLTSSANPATQGVSDTLTATEAPATAGSVAFMDGTTTLGTEAVNATTGVATLATTFATAGSHSLSAVFTPTDTTDFSASTGTLSLTVNGNGTATPTTTALTSSANPATVGVSDTLTATETPATAGSVAFMDGTTTLGTEAVNATTGVATLATTFATAGSHSLSAVFTPTDTTDFSGSTGTLSLTVNSPAPTSTTTTLVASPTSAKVGAAETLTAAELPATAGSVAFKDGTTSLGTATVNTSGVATLSHTFTTTGTHSLSAVFTPTNTTGFTGSTGTLSLSVGAGTFRNIRKPSLGGPHEITKRETVGIGTWSPKPTTVRYQWFLGSSKIKGATHSSFIIPKADRDRKIHAVVTVSASGFTTVSASSNTVTVIGLPLRVVHRPVLSGAARVGHRETITKGTWSPVATRVTYQWFVNGKAVRGATRPTFIPTKADKGKLVKVVVTAIRAGFADGRFTSAAVRIKAA